MYLLTSQELLAFLRAQGISLFLSLLYDFLMSTKTEKMKKWLADFFDTAVLFVVFVIFLIMWQSFLAGEDRWYIFAAVFLTVILYYLTIHRPVFTACCIIVKKIYSFFYIILKFLLTVRDFLGKIVMYLFAVCKKIYSVDYEGNCYEKKQPKT